MRALCDLRKRAEIAVFIALGAVSSSVAEIPVRSPRIVEKLPHDPNAFTQCLMSAPSGDLVEGTGLYGQSEIRLVRAKSGEAVRRVALPAELFGEGCALVAGDLVQLTWREHLILRRDPGTFAERGRLPWPREGWGAAAYGDTLWISDGSDELFKVLMPSGRELGRVKVTADGRPVKFLNELAEDGPRLVANVWGSDSLAVIDRRSGRVVEWWDARNLRASLSPEERSRAEVLNGVARLPDGEWLLTGKWWPALFRVRVGK